MSWLRCLTGLVLASALFGVDVDRDFSGKWIVVSATGDAADLITPKDVALHIVSGDRTMEFTAGTSRWTYHPFGRC